MSKKNIQVETVGEAYLNLLADRGVDYLFANSGTDFAPIIEPMCKPGARYPQPITVPHENVAVSMAHGYYMVSGRPQAVMLHVSVGTANGICAVMNASRAQVPMLFTAGRTPITESGLTGSRDVPIHWPQEMFDQAGMLRELVKWDYELRNEHQLEAVVDRALNMAMSEPKGPIYLSLPREVIAKTVDNFEYNSPSRHKDASAPFPDPSTIRTAARMLAAAKNPLIITSSVGRDGEAVQHLATLAERYAIPVTQKWARTYNLPTDHSMHLGFEPGPLLTQADLVLVLEADVPWVPSYQGPSADCSVIHMGTDPLYARYPMRSHQCDLAVTGVLRASLPALIEAMGQFESEMASEIEQRRNRIRVMREKQRQDWARSIECARTHDLIQPVWISHCLDQVKGPDAIILKEGAMVLEPLSFSQPHTFFHGHAAGGLGWALGAGLGAKLACPGKLVVNVIGDGSYMFGCPVAAHSVGQQYGIPTLTIIINNRMWGAVRQSTASVYPDGHASRTNNEPLVALDGTPNLERVVEASGGYGERVEVPGDLPAALERAIHAVMTEGRQAVLNVITQPPQATFSGSEIKKP